MKNIEVLLVEPVKALRLALKMNMEKLGWKIDSVFDESSGLEKALNKHFDLILIEISQYDKMDGFELISKIKEQTVVNKSTPLCTVTVHNIPENREKARALGVDAFFEGLLLHHVVQDIDEFMKTIS